MVTATELFKINSQSLAMSAPPEWDSPDAPGVRDTLVYLDNDADEDRPLWALLPTALESPDYVAIDTAMACELIKAHLRTWLRDRSWQIQVIVQKNAQRWRLADCLSIADGGGDRLGPGLPVRRRRARGAVRIGGCRCHELTPWPFRSIRGCRPQQRDCRVTIGDLLKRVRCLRRRPGARASRAAPRSAAASG